MPTITITQTIIDHTAAEIMYNNCVRDGFANIKGPKMLLFNCENNGVVDATISISSNILIGMLTCDNLNSDKMKYLEKRMQIICNAIGIRVLGTTNISILL